MATDDRDDDDGDDEDVGGGDDADPKRGDMMIMMMNFFDDDGMLDPRVASRRLGSLSYSFSWGNFGFLSQPGNATLGEALGGLFSFRPTHRKISVCLL